ncbi:hypothetical protein E4U21_002276 [Claviceps maximensis]|nr:hypothetical protein E4U21_002276 [Claviceps maximensis]
MWNETRSVMNKQRKGEDEPNDADTFGQPQGSRHIIAAASAASATPEPHFPNRVTIGRSPRHSVTFRFPYRIKPG